MNTPRSNLSASDSFVAIAPAPPSISWRNPATTSVRPARHQVVRHQNAKTPGRADTLLSYQAATRLRTEFWDSLVFIIMIVSGLAAIALALFGR